jgi:hypothetical protein
MKAVAGQMLGILLVLTGAGFVVAAFGGLGSVGVQSVPQQWVFGFAALLAGRILLAGTVSRPRVATEPEMGLEARLEEIINPSAHPNDPSSDAAAVSVTASKP